MIANTAPDVIARFSIGDNIVCVAHRRPDGFSVFIDGELLPNGDDERFFLASKPQCLKEAFEFALTVVTTFINEELMDDVLYSAAIAAPIRLDDSTRCRSPIGLLGAGETALLAERITSQLMTGHLRHLHGASSVNPTARQALRNQHRELAEEIRDILREEVAWFAHDEESSS